MCAFRAAIGTPPIPVVKRVVVGGSLRYVGNAAPRDRDWWRTNSGSECTHMILQWLVDWLRQVDVKPSALDQDEQHARIAKLHAETRLLEEQLSPRNQKYQTVTAIAGVAGLITATAAILGLVFPVYQ